VLRRWWLWLAWLALALVLAGALAVAHGGGARPTEAQRVARITSEVRCPECAGQSVADSNTKAAAAVRDEVARQVRLGRSDAEIERDLVDRYGTDILLRPPSSGIATAVWALPVAAFVLAVAGLAVAFRRWRRLQAAVTLTPDDRALVNKARAARER